jgi:hypothetical protein
LGRRERLRGWAWLPWRRAKLWPSWWRAKATRRRRKACRAWGRLAKAPTKRLRRWRSQVTHAKARRRDLRLIALPGRVGSQFKCQLHSTRAAQRNRIAGVQRLGGIRGQLDTVHRRAIGAAHIDHLIAPTTQGLYLSMLA